MLSNIRDDMNMIKNAIVTH